MKNPVYTHVEKINIASSHGNNINYLVCYEYVDWRRDANLRLAVYVLMEYQGKVSYETPPHIMTDINPDGSTDLEKVLEAINTLKTKYNS